jgi:hypothetical protein
VTTAGNALFQSLSDLGNRENLAGRRLVDLQAIVVLLTKSGGIWIVQMIAADLP